MSDQEESTVLYRPVGERELDLILESDNKNFLPDFLNSRFSIPGWTEEIASRVERKI